jgi:large subunit ribosomal protein L25
LVLDCADIFLDFESGLAVNLRDVWNVRLFLFGGKLVEKVSLEVRLRQDMSKHHLKEIRKAGFVPGSLYGKGKPQLPLEVPIRALAQALHTEAGIHTILDLKIDGAKKSDGGTAVIKSIQKDPLTRKVLHVDFERVAMSDVIHTTTSIVLHGTPVGVKEGGVLEQLIDEIDIKCRADHIPPHIDVDVTNLKIGEFIHASEIPLPEGVELAGRPDDIVVAVRHPHVRVTAEKPEVEEVGVEELAETKETAEESEE